MRSRVLPVMDAMHVDETHFVVLERCGVRVV